jgi:hypothetical protein
VLTFCDFQQMLLWFDPHSSLVDGWPGLTLAESTIIQKVVILESETPLKVGLPQMMFGAFTKL